MSQAAQLTTRSPIQAIAEFDVTEAQTMLHRSREKKGETTSFTAWLIKCIAQAVSEDKRVQAYGKGKHFFVFEDVDVAFVMDRASDSGEMVANAIVRKANEKSLETIHQEIRITQQEKPVHGTSVGESEEARLAGRLQSLPGFVRRLGVWWYGRNPGLRKRAQGTVGITSVGNILGTSSSMWGCPIVTGMFTLMFGISGIARKPGIVGDQILARDYLSMSIMFDHYAVDGAEAARFLKRLGELFTCAYGIDRLD